jgi:hypothetical protein
MGMQVIYYDVVTKLPLGLAKSVPSACGSLLGFLLSNYVA